jgi:hypothetical protein
MERKRRNCNEVNRPSLTRVWTSVFPLQKGSQRLGPGTATHSYGLPVRHRQFYCIQWQFIKNVSQTSSNVIQLLSVTNFYICHS